MRIFVLSFFMVLVGCSTVQKVGIRSVTPLFQASGQKVTRENSWQFFKESSPANIKFMEMIYLSDPDNLKLLGVLVKSLAGYGYGVPETLYYGDELAGVEDSPWKNEAIITYTKALDYGLVYLQNLKITRSDLLELDEKELVSKLDRNLDEDDYVPALYFAQAWGSLINLQKDNVALVSQVPKVKILFDWVCSKNKDIEHGVCDIFYAQYEAARPKMLGGNPEKARELYEAAIKKYPKHLLVRVGYLQYLILPGFEQEKYEKEATSLREEIQKWSNLNRDTLDNKSEYHAFEDLNLYNAIAKKRFEFMEKNKNKIF